VLPTIMVSGADRDGVADFQCMLTEGSSDCVPESSMMVVLAGAAGAQIMLNRQAKKKAGTFVPRRPVMARSGCSGRGR
jgi:hypothetical protein